ncbi:conserved protein, unknown function [Hepatocystis sp. ex Piliocolobus tephrosceles]|nr:conserved protein, unknown function [Hepatocystis sp. ex Piliocolobus tephrosceles]
MNDVISYKTVIESPYNIEIKPVDVEKSRYIMEALFEIRNSFDTTQLFLFDHDTIVNALENNDVEALILIKTPEYELFYKHISIIASLKNVCFVLIEKCNTNSNTSLESFDKPFVGIKTIKKETNSNLSDYYEKVENLILLIKSYYIPADIPYLFRHQNYINTKFRVERVKGKLFSKSLTRKERKKLRKSLKKKNI